MNKQAFPANPAGKASFLGVNLTIVSLTMMDNERIREICLSLPHAEEAVGWGHHLVFWVGDKAIGGKMFALIHLDDAGTGVAWFHCGAERYQELLETEGIIPAPYMAKAHWVTVERWDVLRARQWEEELRQAHALVYERLPKRTKTVLAMPEKERANLIRERRKLLATKEKAK
jgi:predicted DNA-binding protein (MmcQ/YjbR family)